MLLSMPAVAFIGGGCGDDPRLPALEDDRAFEGTWELVTQIVAGDGSQPRTMKVPEKRRMFVKDGTWREVFNNRTITLQMRRHPGNPYPRIDRTRDPNYSMDLQQTRGGMGGSTMIGQERGIYQLKGDQLTIVIGPWKGPPPDSLEPSAYRGVEVWCRVRR